MRYRVPLLVNVGVAILAVLFTTSALASTIFLPLVNSPSAPPDFYTITGHVQKGPFLSNSQITVTELDSDLQPTGQTLSGTIDTDTGHFTIRGTLTSPYVELSAQGLYFNEVSNNQTAQSITLVALADLSASNTVNINLATHLEQGRIRTLLSQGLSFEEASTRAQSELLAIFNLLPGDAMPHSTELDIAQTGDDNALLLAVSLVLQGELTPAQLADLLASIAADISPDGVLDSPAAQQTLIAGMEHIKPRQAAIRVALQDYYSDQGALAVIPPFESYTLALDTVAPTVFSTSPANGADQGVRDITVLFNERMQHSTLTPQTISLQNSQGAVVQGSLLISDTVDATQATFVPTQDLSPGAYKLSVATEVSDLAGNLLAESVATNFVHTPIGYLSATNSSPTRLNEATELIATITATSDPVTYTWDLGDGTLSNGATVQHTYPAVGDYTARVTARNNFSSTTTATKVSIIDRTIAGLQISAADPTRLNDATVFVAGVQDGTNIVYEWDFGDGATATGEQVNHTYATVGDYTVTLTAGNSINQVATTKPVSIIDRTIEGLSAEFSSVIAADDSLTLRASVDDGTNVTYNWTFGDGGIATGSVVTHTYLVTGYFDITLTAVNSVGQAFLEQSLIVLTGWTQDEVLIPAGTFQMGCDEENLPAGGVCQENNLPLHTVYLDTYHIDKYEVTNARYKACVDAGRCSAPSFNRSATREPYFTDPDYADFPVLFVNWNQARDFCIWDGKRLPTEAEWEKAARGDADTRSYTWGSTQPNCTLLNFNDTNSAIGHCEGDTTRVGSYPASMSPYGVMDMLGNVSELVNDLYAMDYYVDSPSTNPQGPSEGNSNYVRRGASWHEGRPRVDVRGSVIFGSGTGLEYIGFRCARTP